MWSAQIAQLAALGRVVALDGPGHGRSESPPRFTLEDFTPTRCSTCSRSLDIGRVVLAGLSWGGNGRDATRAPASEPRRGARAARHERRSPEPLVAKVRYRAFIAFARRVGMPRQFIDAEVAPLMFSKRALAEHPEYVTDFTRAVNAYPRDGLARAALAVIVHRKNIRERLGNIRVPTLVVCGREDRATPPRYSEAIAQGIPGARLVWLDRCGHLSAIEQPRAVNDALVVHSSAGPPRLGPVARASG